MEKYYDRNMTLLNRGRLGTIIPNEKWGEIVGNQKVKDTLLDLPMCQNPDDSALYKDENEDPSTAILLFGPPGTVSC